MLVPLKVRHEANKVSGLTSRRWLCFIIAVYYRLSLRSLVCTLLSCTSYQRRCLSKHYGFVLKRVHHSVRDLQTSNSTSTLAATLLVTYYEIIAANHTNRSTHVIAAKRLITEENSAGMTKDFKRMKVERATRGSLSNRFVDALPPLIQ